MWHIVHESRDNFEVDSLGNLREANIALDIALTITSTKTLNRIITEITIF